MKFCCLVCFAAACCIEFRIFRKSGVLGEFRIFRKSDVLGLKSLFLITIYFFAVP